ncbi:MAG: class I SAM-dependent methyltransferase, partial [Nanoarchaeota archaeon]
ANITLFMDKKSVKNFYETFDFEKMINDQAPELIQEFLDGEIEFISEHIKPNSSILEIGCGYGRLLKIMAKKSKQLVGIDFSNRMVELSKKNLEGKENVDIQLMEADKLTFNDNFFDYVVCLDNSFGNMPKIELDVLKEMKRVCKNGGEIIISVFSENAKDVQRENYERIGLTNIKDDGKAIHTAEGFYSRRFAKEELKSLFNNAGLEPEIVKICPINYIAYAPKTL